MSTPVKGTISVPRISGDITVFMAQGTFMNLVNQLQMGASLEMAMGKVGSLDHYIHAIEFGKPFPLSSNPLSNKLVTFPTDIRVALDHMNVKLVPTKYK